MKLYTMSHLYAAFAKEGISLTNKNTYLKYERLGIITPGKYSIVHGKRVERVFTHDEIQENIFRFKQFKTAALQSNIVTT